MVDADGTQLGIYRKSHIPDGPGTPRSTTSAPATPASASGTHATVGWVSRSAGTTVVPRERSCDGVDGCRGAAVPDRHRQRAAGPDVGLERPLAAGDAGARRRQPDATRGGEPHRPRGRPDVLDHLLRLVVHRRQPPVPRSPRRVARAKPSSSPPSTGLRWRASAAPGASSVTVARPLRSAAQPRRAQRPPRDRRARAMTWRMPGEFEPHERTVMCWPSRHYMYARCSPTRR